MMQLSYDSVENKKAGLENKKKTRQDSNDAERSHFSR